MSNFLDELVHITVHKDEIKNYPKAIQKFIADNSDMEWYPGGLKKDKPFNKQVELKRLIKELAKVRAKYKGEENNIECLVYDQILELFGRMMLHELRKVKLEKLL